MNHDPLRMPGGWPAWEQQAEQILNGIRAHILQPDAIGIVALGQSALQRKRGENASQFAFHDFLRILDAFLSQLINWTEQKELGEPSEWAGQALVDRIRFLTAQEKQWEVANPGFAKRMAEFGDRRAARAPESFMGWLAGDYLRGLFSLQRILFFVPIVDGERSPADVLPELKNHKRWLERLKKLPNFDEVSWEAWADAVFDRMREDEDAILARPELRPIKTHRKYRRDRKPRLYDWKKTISGAIESLARKQVGTLRGITRPSS